MTVVIGGLYIRETRHVKIWDEVGGERPVPTAAEAGAVTEATPG
jgi:hypothetical protein